MLRETQEGSRAGVWDHVTAMGHGLPSPVWSKAKSQHDEDLINPRESVTKRSFNKEEADANVGAKLTLLWMVSWFNPAGS